MYKEFPKQCYPVEQLLEDTQILDNYSTEVVLKTSDFCGWENDMPPKVFSIAESVCLRRAKGCECVRTRNIHSQHHYPRDI